MANENYGVFGECSSDFFSLIILNMILIRNVGFVLFFWTVGQVLLCPSLQSGQIFGIPRFPGFRLFFVEQAAPWRARYLLAKKQVSFRKKTHGEKLHGCNF